MGLLDEIGEKVKDEVKSTVRQNEDFFGTLAGVALLVGGIWLKVQLDKDKY